jgi:hypothetical protein
MLPRGNMPTPATTRAGERLVRLDQVGLDPLPAERRSQLFQGVVFVPMPRRAEEHTLSLS